LFKKLPDFLLTFIPENQQSVMKKIIGGLFEQTFGCPATRFETLPGAGSHRRYFRLEGKGNRCIAVYSPDPLETRAFLDFTRHFGQLGLHVPQLLAEDSGRGIYLLQDMGDRTLKDEVDRSRRDGDFPERIPPLYRQALMHLLRFQVEGHAGLNYSVCVPRPEFDRQSMMWDLNHFKYYFLKLLGIPFDEQALEDDFGTFTGFLTGAESKFFLYRDFQSRNIMILDNDLYFIDYQGGRKGALQYDLASILFEARVDLSPGMRDEMLEFYLEQLQDKTGIRPEEFKTYYWGFVLVRILQAMGAYGIRGIVENKPLFLQSIPFGIRNIGWLLDNSLIPDKLPELTACLHRICSLEEWKQGVGPEKKEGYNKTGKPGKTKKPGKTGGFKEQDRPGELRVLINSFSYKRGLPRDLSGNGGGFVFDCRALPNPGGEEKYRSFTGLDREVMDFLEGKDEVRVFLDRAFSLVEQSVAEYRSREFDRLMVSFGCTGGQHRSVYCAERLQELLRDRLNVKTLLVHRELEI
jgi:aminoglycoside/choline kinase family phosphotransferase